MVRLVRRARMVAREDAVHERAVDRTAVHRLELRKFFLPLGERGAAFTGPHEGVEREARHALGMALGEERGLERARGDAVHQQVRRTRLVEDEAAAGGEVVGAVGDVVLDRARLVRAAVALVVHRPGVVAQAREVLHCRGVGTARHVEVEGRLRGHRRAVHEEDGAARLRARRGLPVPEKQAHVALVYPVLGAAFPRGRGAVCHAFLHAGHRSGIFHPSVSQLP